MVAKRIVKLLKPQRGSLVVGIQVGNERPGEVPNRSGGSRYAHSLESWRNFWKEVGDEVGVRFEVEGVEKRMEVKLRPIGDISLEYSVRRL